MLTGILVGLAVLVIIVIFGFAFGKIEVKREHKEGKDSSTTTWSIEVKI